jgi:hypothetical protein
MGRLLPICGLSCAISIDACSSTGCGDTPVAIASSVGGGCAIGAPAAPPSKSELKQVPAAHCYSARVYCMSSDVEQWLRSKF